MEGMMEWSKIPSKWEKDYIGERVTQMFSEGADYIEVISFLTREYNNAMHLIKAILEQDMIKGMKDEKESS